MVIVLAVHPSFDDDTFHLFTYCNGHSSLPMDFCFLSHKATLDYNATFQLIELAPEERQQTVTIAILDDDLREDMERFSVQLRVPPGGRGVVLGNLSSAEVVIVDDDSRLSVLSHTHLILSTKPYQNLASFPDPLEKQKEDWSRAHRAITFDGSLCGVVRDISCHIGQCLCYNCIPKTLAF